MANQPTKYSKFLIGAASAALVASAVAPVASAADFKDTKGNTHEAAIDALSDAGVITGYTDGTFKPNKTLTRSDVVKLMGKWLVAEGSVVPTDYKTNMRFADLKSTSNDELLKYAAVVKDNGVFVGTPDGKLNAAGDISRENMAVVLVRAFDRVHDIDLTSYVADQNFKKDVTDLGKAKAEARPAIDVLDFFDITNPAAPAFNPKGTTTRGQFATFLYKTTKADFSDVTPGVVVGAATVKAVNATTVEVTFKNAITAENLNSLDFKIDGLTVSNAAVKQSDDKTVVLTTAVQKGGENYTVTLNAKAIGSFKGISNVIPTTIKLTNTSAQSKVGNQVILSAYVGVKEAGVPVTFNVDAPTGSLNKDQVFEVFTNADGIATFSYTQYSAGEDQVAVYPTGAATVRDFATVYWGVDNILTIEEDKAGNTVANGTKKVYTVTYKNPKTGAAVSNADLNVTFKENIDVAFNAISKASVTDPQTGLTVTPYQALNGSKESIQVKTDSNGKATFVVSGTNTAVTPVVFVDGETASVETIDNGKRDASELTAESAKTTFEGAQLSNVITVERDGEEEAAAGITNGRAYKVKVVDKDGKAYANGTVQVGLDEVLDNVITTESKARFADKDSKDLGQQTTLKLDKDGLATIYLYGADNTSGTPVIWIDQNTSENYTNGKLESGEPTNKGAVSNFQYERVIGGLLSLEGEETNQTITDGIANYKFEITNQSGNTLDRLQGKLTYEIRNTSGNPILVTALNAAFKKADGTLLSAGSTIEGYGSVTISADVASVLQSELQITNKDGKSVSALVTPTFRTADLFDASNDNGTEKDSRDYNKTVTATGLTATIGAVDGIPAFAAGATVEWANISKNTMKLVGHTGTIDYSKATFQVENSILAVGTPGSYTSVPLAKFEDYINGGDIVTFTKGTDGAHVIRLETNVGTGSNNGAVVNNSPVAKTGLDKSVSAGTALTFTAGDLATDADVLDSLTFTGSVATSSATVASAVINGAGNLVVTTSAGASGVATITANVTDGKDITSVSFKVSTVSGAVSPVTHSVTYVAPKAATKATVTSGAFTGATLAVGSKITIALDAAPAITVATAGLQTATQVKDAINATVGLAGVATVDGDKVVLTSTAANVGTSSTITITETTTTPFTAAAVAPTTGVAQVTEVKDQFLFSINTILTATEKVKVGNEEYAVTGATVALQATDLAAKITANTQSAFTATANNGLVTLTAKASSAVTTPVITVQ